MTTCSRFQQSRLTGLFVKLESEGSKTSISFTNRYGDIVHKTLNTYPHHREDPKSGIN